MDGVEYNDHAIDMQFENYFYCTDMCDNSLFDDGLNGRYIIEVGLDCIPLYFDMNKTDSEDITSTLRLMNHFLRNALKSNLKNTLFFGLTD